MKKKTTKIKKFSLKKYSLKYYLGAAVFIAVFGYLGVRLTNFIWAQPLAGTFTPVCSPSFSIPSISSYDYPFQPYDKQHPIRANLNDPRFSGSKNIDDATSKAFHFGIDISAADGTPVYAIQAGTVHVSGGQSIAVVAADKELAYWHLDFKGVVVNGQHVAQRQFIGRVAKTWGHIHLAEAHRSPSGQVYYVNPIRPGALAPFADYGKPVIKSLNRIFPDHSVKPATTLYGSVNLAANTYDIPPVAPPTPWSKSIVSPAVIQWSVKTASGSTIMATRTAVDFSKFMYGGPACPNISLDQVYGSGTVQNAAAAPGNYNFYLIRNWDTTRLKNGNYVITIISKDYKNNTNTRSFGVTIDNAL